MVHLPARGGAVARHGQPGCRRDLLNLHVAKAYHGFAYILRARQARVQFSRARQLCPATGQGS